MSDIYRCPVCGWTPSENQESRDWEHCPNCLSSIHEYDAEELECGGTLEPISIWVKPDDQWEIIQRCKFCGEIHSTAMQEEDNPIKILSIASRPVSAPPFPIERMEELTRMMGGQGDVGGYYDEQGK